MWDMHGGTFKFEGVHGGGEGRECDWMWDVGVCTRVLGERESQVGRGEKESECLCSCVRACN